MDIDKDLIKRIVEEVVKQQLSAGSAEAQGRVREAVHVEAGRDGIFTSTDDAVAAAAEAYKKWQSVSVEVKKACIEEMREVSRANAKSMADIAAAETGLGRAEDKVKKNLLQANKTPGIEDVPLAATLRHGGLPPGRGRDDRCGVHRRTRAQPVSSTSFELVLGDIAHQSPRPS